MKSDKEIKKEFKKKASKEPDKYYATGVLKECGFVRNKCKKCGKWFWSKNLKQNICGDAACQGIFSFYENNPCKYKLDYIQVWKKFSKMFKELGYVPIKRYPVVARWRDDTEFVQASIYDFQPYVVSGEVEPPANPLVVPQLCMRFNDIDNVGITGSHMTCFVMIGQHMFVPPEEWDKNKVFRDIKKWVNDGLGIIDEELTFHEDAWAGGGNFGPCIEFFSRGVEIGNQVYMLYEQTPSGPKELNLKVLDMGMGQERCAWFSLATPTIYDATFPTVMENLRKKVKLKVDERVIKKFVPYAGLLNIDEVEDIDKTWEVVAEKVGIDVEKLKEIILPSAALYSIAEHSRTLLIALSDGALPSNVGGGYNLRVLLRRCLGFIDKYRWDIELKDVCKWHASYLKPLFPELSENLKEVNQILDVEEEKYEATKEKSKKIISKLIKEKIDENKLLKLYDSQGISPEIIAEEAKQLGKEVTVPDDFYLKITEMHEKKEQMHATKKEGKLDLEGVAETEADYFDDYAKTEFKAEVLKIINNNVVLDKTLFYPTSGGQLHDVGSLDNDGVIEVFKQGAVIVHLLKERPKFKEGDKVSGKLDFEHRKQLAQHHSATHIVNTAARNVLGKHINQAGAKKTKGKAHLDITHFRSLSDDELKQIEDESNGIINKNIKIKTRFMSRTEAEKRYGMKIYQGGAVAGKTLRIVEIPGVDVECCGGTHLNNTKEVGEIKIIKAMKISDGIVRIEFKAGKAIESEEENIQDIKDKINRSLRLFNENIRRISEPFQLNITPWTKMVEGIIRPFKEFEKSIKKLGEEMRELAKEFSVTVDQLPQTIDRFIKEYNQQVKEIIKLEREISKLENRKPSKKEIERINFKCDDVVIGKVPEFGRWLFTTWKKQKKQIERLNKKLVELRIKKIKGGSVEIVDLDVTAMQKIAKRLNEVLLINKKGLFVFKGDNKRFKKLVSLGAKGGGGEIKKGKIDTSKLNKLKELFKR